MTLAQFLSSLNTFLSGATTTNITVGQLQALIAALDTLAPGTQPTTTITSLRQKLNDLIIKLNSQATISDQDLADLSELARQIANYDVAGGEGEGP
jgi:chaperonin GroEL (HSP60 family)